MLTVADRWALRRARFTTWLREQGVLTGMSRHDRRAWGSATTMGDLGELVVAWLHGHLTQTPGHGGPPCDETIPLIPVLTLANRAGFVTDNSQLADDAWWGTCTADVSGFASGDAADALYAAVAGTPLAITACRGREHRGHRRGGRLAVWRGYCPAGDAAGFWAGACPRAAAELHDAWYVMIADPEPARNDVLWPALERFASDRSAA